MNNQTPYPDPFTYSDYAVVATDDSHFLFLPKLRKLWNQIMGFPKEFPADPDPETYKDWLGYLVNPEDYLFTRYANYELLYYVDIWDNLMSARLSSNAVEFTKYALILRNASKQYHDLLLGSNSKMTNENSYTGLNANGVYNTNTNTAETVNTLERLSVALNTAQTEMYLFLDRMMQPFFKLIYSYN